MLNLGRVSLGLALPTSTLMLQLANFGPLLLGGISF